MVPEGLADEQVLFLSDILPTGWMGAENADIQPDDTADEAGSTGAVSADPSGAVARPGSAPDGSQG